MHEQSEADWAPLPTLSAFTGQAFRLDPEVKGQALLVLPAGSRLLLPEVAVLGEAAMLTAQLAGPGKRPVGMNAPEARENGRFALNLLHWLSALLP